MSKTRTPSAKPLQAKSKKPLAVTFPIQQHEKSLLSFLPFNVKVALLALIGFGFYINSVNNEFALDDGIVIENNAFVMRGFSGIWDILTHDAYQGFYEKMHSNNQLAGGRYRPLSIVTFAIEQEFIGTYPEGGPKPTDWDTNKNGKLDAEEDTNGDGVGNEKDCFYKGAHFRHGVNVVLYVFSVVLLFFFLSRHIFRNHQDVAFLTALIFLVHPLHTEVVANIKSRDEIMSFLFIVLTMLFFARHLEAKNDSERTKSMFLGLGSFFLALLSKEYAMTLVVLLPIMARVFYPQVKTTEKLMLSMVPFFILFVIYLIMRVKLVGLGSGAPQTEVLNNPYLFASKTQRKATIFFVLILYIKLLLFPHPLSSDYSFAQIAYRNFSDPEVWLSIAVHIAIIVFAINLSSKRNPIGFALMFYLGSLALVGNVLMDIGATMGERLIYHSSLGFAIAVAWIMVKVFEKWKATDVVRRATQIGLVVVAIALCGFKTIKRNAEWKNDITLFIKDAQTVPNSVLANGNAGARYIDIADFPVNKDRKTELLQKAVFHLTKSLKFHPRYVNGYLNLGLAHYKLNHPDSAKINWDKARELYPNNPFLEAYYPLLTMPYINEGLKYGKEGKFDIALQYLQQAANINPNDANIWYHLGGAYFSKKDYESARGCWIKAVELNPQHTDARKMLEMFQSGPKK